MPKTKIHTQYKTKDGARVPSVTTVIGILNKPALLNWAWELGTQGIDYKAVRDQAGDIGSLAHYLIMSDIKGEKPDVSEYSKNDLGKAETCLLKYYEWQKKYEIKPLLTEKVLVSEQWRFGGTIDCFAETPQGNILVDFKTGKAIYDEHLIQVAAYSKLLEEKNYLHNRVMILRIGRDETEGFEERMVGNLEPYWRIFLNCLAIYTLQGEIRRNK